MHFNVAQQLKEMVGSIRTYQLDHEVLLSPEEGWGPLNIDGSVTMLKTNRGILVTGTFHTEKVEMCSRCLELYHEPLPLVIQEEYFPETDIMSGAPLPMPEEAGPFTIDPNHTLDLREAVRHAILLAIPMKPVCRPDCAGLCLHCGHNLNQGPCVCQEREKERV